jgi:hypothetical protein
MKLKTSLTASRDGSIVDATDENLIHDAAAAHALMQAIKETRDNPYLYGGTSGHPESVIEMIEERADELMAGWGFDSGEDA